MNLEASSALPIFIKIGGSLITRKDGFCEQNTEKIFALGHELAGLEAGLRQRLIMALGGGSFGHGILMKFGLLESPVENVRADISRMTSVMFGMMSSVADTWREAGLSVYPIQIATKVCAPAGELQLMADSISMCLSHRLMPLVTGDVALLEDGSLRLISSDWLAVLIAREIRISGALFLTDVPGILDRGNGETIRMVSLRACQAARANAGASVHPDVSGGMAAKLDAALALAAMGVPSRIIDGRGRGSLTAALTSERWLGTQIAA